MPLWLVPDNNPTPWRPLFHTHARQTQAPTLVTLVRFLLLEEDVVVELASRCHWCGWILALALRVEIGSIL